MKKTAIALLLLLACAIGVQAQTSVPFSVEIGYRFLDLKGDEGMYRTQINEKEGILLRSFSMTAWHNGERMRIDASDLGAGPAGALHLEADRAGLYRFRLGYRRADAFSALPAFANPLLGQGVVPGQHTYDRTRTMVDADFELTTNERFIPFLGYSYNRYDGPGSTTYHLGQDEFRLLQDLKDTDHEIRAGAGFSFGPVTGQFTQGWRRFRGSESLTLAPGAGAGNNIPPVLGRPVTADTITRNEKNSVDTPFTNFYITGQAGPRVRLIGNYVRFAADGDGSERETAAGSFASFELGRFFTGINESVTSRAKNTTWRGGARAEFVIADGLDAFAGFQSEHRSLEGSAVIDTLYLQTITFGGADARDIHDLLDANSSIDRDEDTANIGISARNLGPFAIRAELREAKQNVDVSPDVAEIVVPGAQGGSFDRRIRTFDTNASYSNNGLMVGAAWRHDSANDPIFRTDFLDRDRYRLRATYAAPKWVKVGATAEEMKQTNDRPDTDLDAKLRSYSADFEVAPVKVFSFRGSVSQFRADSSILYRRPENFNTDLSVHVENGRGREGGVSFALKKLALDADYGSFHNSGSYPFTLRRAKARATLDITPRYGVAFEYGRDKYDDRAFLFGDYDATRYGIFLRWNP